MTDNYIVKANNVYKTYKLYKSQNDRIFDLLFGKKNIQEFHALRDVSFTVNAGESVGLVGLNGSGKSTLADIVAGISEPSRGTIDLRGNPALIAIGAGLNAQLTGIENIEFKSLLIGLSHNDINELKKEIIDFADIGDFINQPVKTYSSGMRARLGFAISVNINPDILVIDEALAVGDPSYIQKCLDRIEKFRIDGKTIFFVSHSLPQIEAFCTKAIWLEYGILKAYGMVREVLPMYERFLAVYGKMTKEERVRYEREKRHHYNTLFDN